MQPEDCGPSEDTQLVAECQNGDRTAFDRLVTKYRNQVYATIYSLARNDDDAWDLAQETFLKAWRHIAHFRGQSKFSTWLHRIATNVTIDWVRRKQIASGVEFDDSVGLTSIAAGSITAPHAAPAPQQHLEAGEIQARIDTALGQLSPEHRTVILLREVDGASYEEIAEATGCTLGTVMSRLFYARKKLQTLLRDVYETL